MRHVPRFIQAAIFLLMLVSLMACGRGVQGALYDRGEFGVYFDRWTTASQAHGRAISADDMNVEIRFGNTEGESHYGLCVRQFLKNPVVYFDETKWRSIDDKSRESLFFHEMGHCILGREHNDEKKSEYQPVSLMNAVFVNGTLYEKEKATYLTELFGK